MTTPIKPPKFTPTDPLLKLDIKSAGRDCWIAAVAHTFKNGAFDLAVPKGFRSDLASIPWLLLWIVGPSQRHQRAALFHDAGYAYKPTFRSTIDESFRAIMLHDGVHPVKAWILWAAVRLFGGRHWHPPRPKKPRRRGIQLLACSAFNPTTAAI